KKWLSIIGIAILTLLLLATAAWLWLTHTESGARWAVARASGFVERLDFDAFAGGLASGLTLQGVDFAHAGMRVSADQLELAARVELLSGPRVVVRRLRGRGIDIHPPQAQAPAEEKAESAFDLSALASPIDIVVEELDLRQLTIHAGSEPL